MTLDEHEKLPPEEKDHFFQCPKCGRFVDGRELPDVRRDKINGMN